MKKILTLIGANVLIITAATPMIINLNSNITTNTKTFTNKEQLKINNQKTNLSLNKEFSINGNSELVLIKTIPGNGGYKKDYELIFTPDSFEIMVNIYHGRHWGSTPNLSTVEYFKKFVFDTFQGANKNDPQFVQQLTHLWNYGITKNWKEMISKYTNSSKNQRWTISFSAFINWEGQIYSEFKDFNSVTTDTKSYLNAKWETLNGDFNGDLENRMVNLGILPNSDSDTIKQSLSQIYRKLSIKELEIVKVESYSISKGFLLKLRVKEDSLSYSIGNISNDFIFNTKINLKKINDIFDNDSNIKIWIHDMNDWKQRVNREIKEDVPTFNDAQKRTWKDNIAEQMKSYMRDWNIIMKIIDIEIKLEDLNNVIKDIKKDIQTLKEQIADINQKIADINKENNQCDAFDYVGTAASLIPGFGDIIYAVMETFNMLCSVMSE